MNWIKAVVLSLTVLLAVGCSSTPPSSSWVFPPMARPLQAPVDKEVQLVRLSQLLQRDDLSDDLRAKIYFERGNNYDLLGLRNLARYDFEQSLRYNPAQSQVFNMLGVYFTQVGDFDSAYEAFGSSLELDENNVFTMRNQAIALYYGHRPTIALEEINKLKNAQVDDPFAFIWYYLIEFETDPVDAHKNLNQAYVNYGNDEEWGWNIVAMMLGNLSATDLFNETLEGTRDNQVLAERLTEVYFYLGKRDALLGKYASAISLFKLAMAFNVYEYVEHRYASLELEGIYFQLQQLDELPVE
ncbi:lipoprotein NlpI [Vibrio sp. WJH972]